MPLISIEETQNLVVRTIVCTIVGLTIAPPPSKRSNRLANHCEHDSIVPVAVSGLLHDVMPDLEPGDVLPLQALLLAAVA